MKVHREGGTFHHLFWLWLESYVGIGVLLKSNRLNNRSFYGDEAFHNSDDTIEDLRMDKVQNASSKL